MLTNAIDNNTKIVMTSGSGPRRRFAPEVKAELKTMGVRYRNNGYRAKVAQEFTANGR